MRTRNSLTKGTDTEEEDTKSQKKKKNVKVEKSEDQKTSSQNSDPPRRSRRVKKENSSSVNKQEDRPEDRLGDQPEDRPGPSGIQTHKTKLKNNQIRTPQKKVQRQPMPKSSETSSIPRKNPPSLQRNKISRSATPSTRRVKTEIAATQLPSDSKPISPTPPSPGPEMPELIPELIPVPESIHGPSNSLENKNDSSIPKQENKKVKEEKKPVMNVTDNGNRQSSENQNNPNASIIELDDIDDGVRIAAECIILSDNDSDDGIQVIGEVRKATRFVPENSLVDLTNDPIIDPKPGPSGLQTKNR